MPKPAISTVSVVWDDGASAWSGHRDYITALRKVEPAVAFKWRCSGWIQRAIC